MPVLFHKCFCISGHGLVDSAPVTAFEKEDVSLLSIRGVSLFNGIIHPVLFHNVIESPDLFFVRKLSFLHALVLVDQFFDGLLSLGFYVTVLLCLVVGIVQELGKDGRQRTRGQVTGIDDQGN